MVKKKHNSYIEKRIKNANKIVVSRSSIETGEIIYEIDKFKGKYKLMASEVECYWCENSNMINGIPKVNFWPKNISELSIIKFIPMQEAIPKELNNI